VSSQCHIWKNTKETYHEKHMEEKLNIRVAIMILLVIWVS